MSRVSLAMLVLVAGASAAAAEAEPFNVDLEIGWDGCYRPTEWTPVSVGIAGRLAKPFGGVLRLSALQDQLTKMTVVQPFVLTPDLPLSVPLQMKIAFGASNCQVEIRDLKGRRKWSREYNLWDYSRRERMLTVVNECDMLIGLVGRSGFGLLQVPEQTHAKSERGVKGKVYLRQKLPRRLGWDWTGYTCLDVLVLYNPPWQQINVHQARAISEWVANGGKLLVVLGHRPLPADHPIAEILPVKIGDAAQLQLLSSFSGLVDGWQTARKPGAVITDVHRFGTGEELYVVGMSGFGRVGVLSFDPAPLMSTWPAHKTEFWYERISALLETPTYFPWQRKLGLSSAPAARGPSYSRYYQSGKVAKATNRVLEHLMSIKELEPLSIWWVVGLLTGLAILLGPVDYFVLKGLDRQPLTWLTAVCVIAVFAAGAYYGVEAIRAGQMQMRVVSVCDGIAGKGGRWSTSYVGLFAPKSDDYALTNLAERDWWSVVTPTQNYTFGRRKVAVRKIECLQADGSNLPYSIPINIWSMQCLVREGYSDERLPFAATVSRDGEAIRLKLTNHSDRPIRAGYVRLGKNRWAKFGYVTAGGEYEASLKTGWPPFGRNWQVWNRPRSGTRDKATVSQGTVGRTVGIESYLAAGAAVVYAEYDGTPVPFKPKGKPFEMNHVQLVRLVVFPQEGH